MALLRACVLLASALLANVHACTVIAAGRKATADGSVLVTHNDDNGGTVSDLRLVRVPAMDHPPGSVRPVYKFQDPYPRVVANERGPTYSARPGQDQSEALGFIPQVAHTFAYHDADYGMVNEHQLSIAESTTSSKFAGFAKDLEGGNQLFAIDELSRVALERCKSARCAVQTMGDLAVEYGFYSGSSTIDAPHFGDASETLAVGDKFGEVWVFHVMAGPNNASAVWAAQRIPDDHVTVIANGLIIREMDLEDTDNFLASPNVLTAAIEAGFWDPESGKTFDFTAAYGYIPDDAHGTSLYIGRRIWRVYSILAPSQTFDPYVGFFPAHPTYPVSIKPDAPVEVGQILDILKDTYEGTEFDLSKGAGAGPFGYPVRFGGNKGTSGGWERPISMYRTLWSFAIQSRPDMPDVIGGLVWYGPDAPLGSVWIPVYASSDRLPAVLGHWGKMSEFNKNSIWWVFHFVNDWVSRKFSVMKGDVEEAQQKVQSAAFDKVAEWEAKALKICSLEDCDVHDQKQVRSFLERASAEFAESVVESWWSLAWRLVAKYQSAYVVTAESSEGTKSPGYPEEWLNTTEWYNWPSPDTYKPPAGADKTWANVLKQRAEEAKQMAHGEAHAFPWMVALLSFLLGALLACAVYYFASERKRNDYAPLQ